jgi:hypothetical protein
MSYRPITPGQEGGTRPNVLSIVAIYQGDVKLETGLVLEPLRLPPVRCASPVLVTCKTPDEPADRVVSLQRWCSIDRYPLSSDFLSMLSFHSQFVMKSQSLPAILKQGDHNRASNRPSEGPRYHY